MEFWKRLKQLFKAPTGENPDKNCASENQPLLHTVIERSEQEQLIYTQWEISEAKEKTLQWLQTQYNIYRQNPSKIDCHIDFLMIPSVHGFVLHYDAKQWDCDDFMCLFDYLKNKTKALGYTLQVSDNRSVRCCGSVETVQRYFLKPPGRLQQIKNGTFSDKLAQLYGNIMISVTFTNEKLVNLKFSATHYNDHAYLPPQPFEELMSNITSF